MNNNEFGRREVSSDKVDYNQSTKYTKRSFLKENNYSRNDTYDYTNYQYVLLKPLIPTQYLIYFQTVQVVIIGYAVIEIIGNTAFNLVVATNNRGRQPNQ